MQKNSPKRYSNTVSYTHLDVYKRQIIHSVFPISSFTSSGFCQYLFFWFIKDFFKFLLNEIITPSTCSAILELSTPLIFETVVPFAISLSNGIFSTPTLREKSHLKLKSSISLNKPLFTGAPHVISISASGIRCV